MPKLRLSLLSAAVAASLPLAVNAAPDLDSLTASQAAADICAGKYTSEALVGAALARARARADLNAFVTLDEAGALKAAKAADAARKGGKTCKPLDGVPVVIKDNIEVAGLPASAGTPALKGFVPKADAPVAAKLRAAGAIVLGKTNMHELAFGISGYNTHSSGDPRRACATPTTHRRSPAARPRAAARRSARASPWPASAPTPAARCAFPARFNGCASLRPTSAAMRSRASRRSRTPATPPGRWGGDGRRGAARPRDRRRRRHQAGRAEEAARRRDGATLANLDADTKAAFEAAVAKMKAAGVTVVEVDMPKLMELNGAVGFPVALYEAYDDMVKPTSRPAVRARRSPTGQGDRQPRRQGHLRRPGDPAQAARPEQHRGRRQARLRCSDEDRPAGAAEALPETFAKHKLDALAFPTVPKVAIDSNPDSSSVPNFVSYIQNTDPGSNAGIPGLQIPLALGAASKLPVGLELDGPAGSDRKLIAIGLALEEVLRPAAGAEALRVG
jgi:Asp-tRNA(Asn)/Glu-tRNA(Gln) amidotransferase A subunit family amidase